jgi:Gentisate 1,2-dioxygenase
MSSTQVESVIDTEEQLLADLEASKTLPLWKQMARLNPPAPNPTTIPNVWKYSAIRLNLERAGKLVPADQAERRVLMLTNPARGMYKATLRFCIELYLAMNYTLRITASDILSKMPPLLPTPSTLVCS